MRPLQIGQNDGSVAVVAAGLEPGERVVTAGQYRQQPGARAQSAAPEAASAAPSQPATP